MTGSVAFGDLPLDPIPEGQSLLVTGRRRLGSQLAQKLLFDGGHDDGVVYVTTGTVGQSLVADVEFRYPEFDRSRLGVVDATGRGGTEFDTDARVEAVSSTGDLTGISIKNSILTTHLQERGVDRIRTCFDTLSLLLLYTNFRTTLRFVHTMAGRVSATDGLGLFVFDPSMHEPQVEYTLQSICDGEIAVRYEGEQPEIQATGLRGQPGGWQPIDL